MTVVVVLVVVLVMVNDDDCDVIHDDDYDVIHDDDDDDHDPFTASCFCFQYNMMCVLLCMVGSAVFQHTFSMLKMALLISLSTVFIVTVQLPLVGLLENRDVLLRFDAG